MFARQFKHCQEVHNHHLYTLRWIKHIYELDKSTAIAQLAENQPHMFAHRQFLALNHMMRMQLGLFKDGTPGLLQIVSTDFRQTLQHGFFNPRFNPLEITLSLRYFIQTMRRQLHLFVFDQAANQFGTRIFRIITGHLPSLG